PGQMEPFPVDRKKALAARDILETPKEAADRCRSGGVIPGHYKPAEAEKVFKCRKSDAPNPPEGMNREVKASQNL
ncbi:uncharacterized protein METZ01_LOCUS277856, partial [marine metagenome]